MGRKTKDSGVDGLLVVDKPAGWTSHDVVAKCRAVFAQKRCGHSGTLDPDATGLLLVGFGVVTKLLPMLTALPKTYTGEVVLGAATTTLDSSGEVIATHDMHAISLDDVRRASHAFIGEIMQVPPMVSALSVGGVRLHELARQGIEVERQPRPVTIHALSVDGEIERTERGAVFAITVTCSSGTYIRTLAADIGTALGGSAHLRNLRRTQIGSFDERMAVRIDENFSERSIDDLLSPADALRDYPAIVVNEELAAKVRNGRVLAATELLDESARIDGDVPPSLVVTAKTGQSDDHVAVIAVYGPHTNETLKPMIVLAR